MKISIWNIFTNVFGEYFDHCRLIVPGKSVFLAIIKGPNNLINPTTHACNMNVNALKINKTKVQGFVLFFAKNAPMLCISVYSTHKIRYNEWTAGFFLKTYCIMKWHFFLYYILIIHYNECKHYSFILSMKWKVHWVNKWILKYSNLEQKTNSLKKINK